MKNITYTKTGDQGQTSLIGGLRVAKYDDRVEAYGTVDELSAFIGVLYDQDGVTAEMRKVLDTIQNKLFTIESHFALDENSEVKKMIPARNRRDERTIARVEVFCHSRWKPEGQPCPCVSYGVPPCRASGLAFGCAASRRFSGLEISQPAVGLFLCFVQIFRVFRQSG